MSDVTEPDALPPEELASAYLDQEATVEQRALVEGDPELLALVAGYADVQVVLTAPVTPLPPDVAETMVAAALAAAAGAGTGAAPVATGMSATDAGATVVPTTAARRAQRSRRALAVAGGLAAAAAVAVVALVISRGGAGDSTAGESQVETTAAAASPPATGREATEAATDAGTQAAAGGGAVTTPAPAAAPGSEAPAAERPAATTPPAGDASTLAGLALEDLGPLADRTEVIAAVRRFATVVPAPGTGPCAPYPPPLATATFQGSPAYLVIVETAPAGNRLALVDIGTCTVLVKVDTAEL